MYSRLLVEQEDICATLEESVCGRETSETTTDDDNLGHCSEDRRMGRRGWGCEGETKATRRPRPFYVRSARVT